MKTSLQLLLVRYMLLLLVRCVRIWQQDSSNTNRLRRWHSGRGKQPHTPTHTSSYKRRSGILHFTRYILLCRGADRLGDDEFELAGAQQPNKKCPKRVASRELMQVMYSDVHLQVYGCHGSGGDMRGSAGTPVPRAYHEMPDGSSSMNSSDGNKVPYANRPVRAACMDGWLHCMLQGADDEQQLQFLRDFYSRRRISDGARRKFVQEVCVPELVST